MNLINFDVYFPGMEIFILFGYKGMVPVVTIAAILSIIAGIRLIALLAEKNKLNKKDEDKQ